MESKSFNIVACLEIPWICQSLDSVILGCVQAGYLTHQSLKRYFSPKKDTLNSPYIYIYISMSKAHDSRYLRKCKSYTRIPI